MPTCRYFLQGICNRDDCPYRHVNVAVDAEICLDFARGYCSLSDSVSSSFRAIFYNHYNNNHSLLLYNRQLLHYGPT